MQKTGSGIGRAMRTARLRCGKSIEDASRDTRVRAEYLDALEHERFEDLGPDVYVRSFLRSYARYLGLNADKVMAVFERAYGKEPPAPAPVERAPSVAPTEAVQLTEHRRPNWVLAGISALIVLAAAGAIGLLSLGTSAPAPADGDTAPVPAVNSPPVQVNVMAMNEVQVTVTVDGRTEETVTLQRGEARSYEGGDRVDVLLDPGPAAQLEVNGQDVGRPGTKGRPFEASYFPTTYRGGSSPTGAGT